MKDPMNAVFSDETAKLSFDQLNAVAGGAESCVNENADPNGPGLDTTLDGSSINELLEENQKLMENLPADALEQLGSAILR